VDLSGIKQKDHGKQSYQSIRLQISGVKKEQNRRKGRDPGVVALERARRWN
jgi:hypothetical protein